MRRHLLSKQQAKIRQALDRLYEKYNHRDCIKPDPLQFVYRYSEPGDMEIAGFLAADLAYGRVQQIEKSLEDLFGRMGASPYEFVRGFGRGERKKLSGFKHRFNTGGDISDLLELLKRVLEQFGSIEKFFLQGYDPGDENIVGALSRFCETLSSMYAEEHGGEVSRGLKYLLAGPAGGSASKRLNLFLRWMVRDDDVDAGLWKSVDKAKLIVPIDVHMGRLCRILGFYNRNTVSLAAAVEITRAFALIEPDDPAKYDFSLSRVGIVENCTGLRRQGCELCELGEICSGR